MPVDIVSHRFKAYQITDLDNAIDTRLNEIGVTNSNRINLDNDGTQVNLIYNTILGILATETPGPSNQFTIFLKGLFVETLTITVPPYVNLVGPATVSSSATPCAFSLLEGAFMSGITVSCNMNLNDGICASFTPTLPYMVTFFTGCTVTSAKDAVSISSGAWVGTSNLTAIGPITGVRVDGAGTVFRFSVVNVSSFQTNGVRFDNGCSAFGNGLNVEGVNIAVSQHGMHVDNGSEVRLASSRAAHCMTGIYVDNGSDMVFSDYTTEDLTNTFHVADPDSIFIQMGGVQPFEKGIYQPGYNVGYIFYDPRNGELAATIGPELHVGDEINPGELAVGGGDSHVRGMVVFQNDNLEVGTWTDITTLLNVIPGDSPVFGGTTAGRCIYTGGDQKYPGLKVELTTGLGVTSYEDVVEEYWNGSTWVTFDHMGTNGSYPYDSRARSWGAYTGGQQVRFENIYPDWQLKTLNGEEKYWTRARINNPIASDGVMKQIKLHTDRFEVNNDGTVELFGRGRPPGKLALHRKNFEEVNGRTISNEDLSYATNDPNDYFRFNTLDNEFIDNSYDAIGYTVEIPFDFDSSQPVRWDMEWYPKNGVYGIGANVYWQIRWLPFVSAKNGATVIMNGSDPVLNASIQSVYIEDPVPDTQFGLKVISGEFKLPDLRPGDKLIFIVERYGPELQDTFTGSAVLEDINLYYTKWR